MVDLVHGDIIYRGCEKGCEIGGAIWSEPGLRGHLSMIPSLGSQNSSPSIFQITRGRLANGSQITIDLKRPTCNGVTMEKTQVFVASIFFF